MKNFYACYPNKVHFQIKKNKTKIKQQKARLFAQEISYLNKKIL